MNCADATKSPAAGLPCAISQLVAVDPAGRQVVLGVTVDLIDARQAPTIRFRLSPGTRQDAGIGLKIDAGREFRLPIGQCDDRRCEAAGRLDADMLREFLAGRIAQVAFIAPGGRQLAVPVALDGFREALDALRDRRAGR